MATDQTIKKKLKVLQFICPTGLFGAERWILALARNYIDHPDIDCCLAVSQESEIQNLAVFEKFKELGLSAYKIAMKGRFDPQGIWRLKNLMQEKNIDIIHTHGYKSDILGLIAGRLAGKKVLATPHGFENANNLKLQLFIKFGCMALRSCDAVAPLSEELQKDMERVKINPDKVHLIINGVDLDEVEKNLLAAEFPGQLSARNEKIIGYVGQIAYRKNIGALIDAFDLLFAERQDVRLLLIGDGPMRTELEQKARNLKSGKNIEFLGYRDDRLQFVRQMSIFCMTSSLEGIPRCMMEAMAVGIPTTAFQIPGIDKLIINNRTGLLADHGNIEGLKKNWQLLLSDNEFAARIGKAGRQHILDNFSARRMANEYTALYHRLLA